MGSGCKFNPHIFVVLARAQISSHIAQPARQAGGSHGTRGTLLSYAQLARGLQKGEVSNSAVRAG